MANTLDPMFPNLIVTAGVTILPADTTALKTLLTAGAQGAKVTAISAATDDTATSDQQLWLTIGATTYLLGTYQIPITAGFIPTVPAINWFDGVKIPGLPIDRDGQRHLLLPAAAILKVSAKVTVTVAKTHYVTAIGMGF